MSEGIEPEVLSTRLNKEAKTHKVFKKGQFEVSRNSNDHTVVQWSADKRVEQFLVKAPENAQELKGTVNDVFFRLKQRLTQPAQDATS